MNVQITLKVDGQEVAQLSHDVATGDALRLEERIEQLKRGVEQGLLDAGCLGGQMRHPCCGPGPETQEGRTNTASS